MHSSLNNVVNSYIRLNGNDEIESTDSLKLLGFHFNSNPDAVHHVKLLVDKFYSKLWTLRFLKKAGMPKANLMRIYENVLRPSAEYSSVVYNSLIPAYMSDRLESVQKQAIKIIHGWDINYEEMLREGTIQSLKQRRDEATLKFALRASQSARFGKI